MMNEITEIKAYIYMHPELGHEQVPHITFESRIQGDRLQTCPLLAYNDEPVAVLREAAQHVANTAGVPVHLVRFTRAEIIQTIMPEKKT